MQVYLRPVAEQHAIRVQHQHLALRGNVAKNQAGGVAIDPVEHRPATGGATAGGLIENNFCVAADIEILPVQHGGGRCLLNGDRRGAVRRCFGDGRGSIYPEPYPGAGLIVAAFRLQATRRKPVRNRSALASSGIRLSSERLLQRGEALGRRLQIGNANCRLPPRGNRGAVAGGA